MAQSKGGRSEELVDPWDNQNDLIDDGSVEAIEFDLNVRTCIDFCISKIYVRRSIPVWNNWLHFRQ